MIGVFEDGCITGKSGLRIWINLDFCVLLKVPSGFAIDKGTADN